MSWLNDFLGIGKSNAELDSEAFPPVIGTDKQLFNFTYKHKHWLANRDVTHHITGDIAIGVQLEHSKIQKWSILMNNVKCDWSLNCLPEIYLFFNCIKRIEIYMDEQGHVLDTLYPISQSLFLKEKKKQISTHVKDKKQAANLQRFFERNLSNMLFLQKIIPHNAVIRTIISAYKAANLHNSQPSFNQLAEPLNIPGYFGNKAVLPLKACWLYKPAQDSGSDLAWLRLGGLDKAMYQKQHLSNWMHTLNGNFDSDDSLKVDFAEQYRFKTADALKVTHLTYANSYLETIVAKGWYKEEEVIISATEKEVTHG